MIIISLKTDLKVQISLTIRFFKNKLMKIRTILIMNCLTIKNRKKNNSKKEKL